MYPGSATYSIDLKGSSINFKSQAEDGKRKENIRPEFGYSLQSGTATGRRNVGACGWRNAGHKIRN